MNNYIPLFDDIVSWYGLSIAAVYGTVLRLCRENGGSCRVKQLDIAAKVGLSRPWTHIYLRRLAKDGYIRTTRGRGASTYYDGGKLPEATKWLNSR